MTSEIHTLQEHLLHTKGQAYVLATIFMVGLAFFWLYLTSKEDKE